MSALPNPFSLPAIIGRRPRSEGPALSRAGSRYLPGWFGGAPGYMGGGASAADGGVMGGWRPILREAQADTQEAWLAATAATIEMMHTSGWMSGGVASARGQIMFEDGLRPNLKPWAGMISQDPKVQAAWARDTEGRFMAAMRNPLNCDWGGRQPFAVILAQAVNQLFATGEIVATLPYEERPSGTHGLKVNLVPSQRLSQQNGLNTIQGVTMDPRTGAPTAYNFHNFNLATGSNSFDTVAARTETGRPVVVHIFDNAAGTVRGITPFAPALRVLRQSDQLGNAQLILSLMQTIFAATVESPLPSAEILNALMGMEEQDEGDVSEAAEEAMARRMVEIETGAKVPQGSFMELLQARNNWYSATNIDLGRFGKIAHLFPGEKLNFNRPNSPTLDYVNFQKFLFAECARAMGIATFQFTGIFDGYTYTTAKMAIDEAWPMTLWRRMMLARLCQATLEAWLEEDILRGYTVLPGGIQQFYAQKDLICRCDWIGPPRPTADDLKTAKALQVERAEGWTSSAKIAGRYGNDWSEEADDQKEFDEYRESLNLPPLPSLGGGGNGAGSAAVAGQGGTERPDRQQDREARLVGAMMRGDDAGVDACLMEADNDRYHFARFAARAAHDFGYRRAA